MALLESFFLSVLPETVDMVAEWCEAGRGGTGEDARSEEDGKETL